MNYILAHQERVQAQITQVESAIAQTEVKLHLLHILLSEYRSDCSCIKSFVNMENLFYIYTFMYIHNLCNYPLRQMQIKSFI